VRLRPARILLGCLGLALGVVGVLALREATLSTHARVEGSTRTEVRLRARTEGGETNQTLGEMVEALVSYCRLEVASDPVGPVEQEGDHRFRSVLAPALDETNRRQLRGCLEDWTLDHVQVDQVTITHLD
jgi:hypothetical protein